MRLVKLAAGIGAATAVVLAGIVTPGAAAGPPSDSRVPDGYLADATDPAVTSLANDYDLTIAEAQARIGWQEAAIELDEELAASDPKGYGGLWIDQDDGGRVKVGATAAATAATARVVESRGLYEVADVVEVEHSLAALEKAGREIGKFVAAANAGVRDKASHVSSATQISKNRVVLRVPERFAAQTARMAEARGKAKALGSVVAVETTDEFAGVEEQACAWLNGDFDCDAPLRGGVRIYYGSSNTPWCSTAFNARSDIDGKWYVLTAAHCGPEGRQFSAFQHRTGSYHVIGKVHNVTTSGNNDAAIVAINNPSGWSPRNWVYVHASSDTVRDPDYTITATSTSPEGTRVCLSGATSGTDCGNVADSNWNGGSGLARARYCSDGGDSGGAVYSAHKARGLHVGVVSGHDDDCTSAVFQSIREAEDVLRVHVHKG